MGGCAERGFGHADHRDAKLGVRVRTQAGPATRIKIGVAIDHQAQPGYAVQHGARRWQLPQVELARLVGQYLRSRCRIFGQDWGEGLVGGHHGRCAGASRARVIHVCGREQAGTAISAHGRRMPALMTGGDDVTSPPVSDAPPLKTGEGLRGLPQVEPADTKCDQLEVIRRAQSRRSVLKGLLPNGPPRYAELAVLSRGWLPLREQAGGREVGLLAVETLPDLHGCACRRAGASLWKFQLSSGGGDRWQPGCVSDIPTGLGVMAAAAGELSVELRAGPDADAEELAQVVSRLRAGLLDLDVASVQQPVRGEAPEEWTRVLAGSRLASWWCSWWLVLSCWRRSLLGSSRGWA